MVATTTHGETIETAEGRCMKCKKTVTFRVSQTVIWKNGMECATGSCPRCDTRVNRILGKAKNK